MGSVTIKAKELESFVADIFAAAGCSKEEGGRIGRYLVSAKGDRAVLELSADGKLLRSQPVNGDVQRVVGVDHVALGKGFLGAQHPDPGANRKGGPGLRAIRRGRARSAH